MNIAEYLSEDLILPGYLDAVDRGSVIRLIGEYMSRSDALVSPGRFITEVLNREKIESTGIGEGVAFPHARTDAVSRIVIGIARSRAGIDFRALDGRPVQLVFMLGVPRNNVQEYLEVLARLARMVKEKEIRENILEANLPADIISLFR